MFKGVEKLSLTETPDPSTKAIVGKKETHIRLNKMSTSNRCFIRKQWWDACHGVVRIKQSQMKSSERNLGVRTKYIKALHLETLMHISLLARNYFDKFNTVLITR